MFSFSRAPFLIALGLICCLILCVQSHPMTLEDRALESRATSPMILEGRATSHMTLEARHTITMRIKGRDYTLKRLSSYEQGQNSVTYRVIGGYRGIAAIVKVIDPGRSRTISDNAKKEKDILRKSVVSQLLDYEKERLHSGVYRWILVIRDLHEDYPQEGSHLAPLHEILLEDPDIDISQAVRHVRDLAVRHATNLAAQGDFVYRDIQPLNVFTDRQLSEVYFIDYGFPGVVDVSSGLFSNSGQAAIRRANALRDARQNAENHYTVGNVRALMARAAHHSGGGEPSSSNA